MLFLVSLVPTLGAEKNDPFASKGETAWQFEAIKEKPYVLEIAYGEHDAKQERALPVFEKESDPSFLSFPTRLSLATSANEAGEFKEFGKHSVKYQISDHNDGNFDLKICIEIYGDRGNRTINTEITISDADWYIISGSTRKENDGPTQAFTTAIRITPTAAE